MSASRMAIIGDTRQHGDRSALFWRTLVKGNEVLGEKISNCEALQVLESMRSSQTLPDTAPSLGCGRCLSEVTMNSLISACAQGKRWLEALELFAGTRLEQTQRGVCLGAGEMS